MGTIKREFPAGILIPRSGTAAPQLVAAAGSSFPVLGYAFDATTEEAIFTPPFKLLNFGVSNTTISVTYTWYADTATSNGVAVGFSLAAYTPNTDSGDYETKGLGSQSIVTDTHLGTVGQRLHDAIGTITSLDSAAADDEVVLKVARVVSDGSDTMTGDMILLNFVLSWSDS